MTREAPTPIAAVIRRVRQAHNFTQGRLSQILFVCQAAVCRYENGSIHPSRRVLSLLLDYITDPSDAELVRACIAGSEGSAGLVQPAGLDSMVSGSPEEGNV